MGFGDLGLVGGQFYAIFFLMVIFWITILALFIIQQRHMKDRAGEPHARSLSNIMVILGIFICFMTMAWIICSASVKRDDLNITKDASSLLIGRNTIYTNFGSLGPTGTNVPVNADPKKTPNDNRVCYPMGLSGNDGDAYNKLFYQVAQQYESGKTFPVTYQVGSTTPPPLQDTIDLQQQRTLAYYRHVYCLNNALSQLLNGNRSYFQGWMDTQQSDFIQAVVDHVNDDPSKVQPNGCITAYINTPDTIACLDPGWNGTTKCNTPNPCFTAMIQSFNAHCLLADDNVSVNLGSGRQGSLSSFGLGSGTRLA